MSFVFTTLSVSNDAISFSVPKRLYLSEKTNRYLDAIDNAADEENPDDQMTATTAATTAAATTTRTCTTCTYGLDMLSVSCPDFLPQKPTGILWEVFAVCSTPNAIEDIKTFLQTDTQIVTDVSIDAFSEIKRFYEFYADGSNKFLSPRIDTFYHNLVIELLYLVPLKTGSVSSYPSELAFPPSSSEAVVLSASTRIPGSLLESDRAWLENLLGSESTDRHGYQVEEETISLYLCDDTQKRLYTLLITNPALFGAIYRLNESHIQIKNLQTVLRKCLSIAGFNHVLSSEETRRAFFRRTELYEADTI